MLTLAQMALKDLRAREIILIFAGAAIAVLLIITGTRFYVHEFREGILFLVLAGALAFVFFRRRKLVLVISLGECPFNGSVSPERLGICPDVWVCCRAVLHRSLVLQKISVSIV